MPRAIPRKRPCRICHHWFLPDARLKNRQKTCADPECQKKWHKRQCADWNKRNSEYFKANYLRKKLERITRAPPNSTTSFSTDKPATVSLPDARINLGLPRHDIQEVIKAEQLVIIEYIVEQVVRRYQNADMVDTCQEKIPIPASFFYLLKLRSFHHFF